ncbi:hypothetical protein FIBSPDRAFT_953856 [Athelia psychrophila]|uniref:DNA 3'-5' helicase n=1 Tax=Athelia psychrophila TaxID=1759441 RepID=A0A166JZN9_9AGAM|nr:hypothetical protein FIBSPDRAFT_953856 [Fibularhizoctonia sp. CBS 109695]
MPILFIKHGIVIVVTPLKILGNQFASIFKERHIRSILMTAANTTNELFKELTEGHYNLIIVSPKLLLNDSRFDTLWGKKKFTNKIINIVLDEAHVIQEWGGSF